MNFIDLCSAFYNDELEKALNDKNKKAADEAYNKFLEDLKFNREEVQKAPYVDEDSENLLHSYINWYESLREKEDYFHDTIIVNMEKLEENDYLKSIMDGLDERTNSENRLRKSFLEEFDRYIQDYKNQLSKDTIEIYYKWRRL